MSTNGWLEMEDPGGDGDILIHKPHDMRTHKNHQIEMREDGPFQQEGYDLMAAAFEVHNENGGGLAEEVYQESFEIELEMRGIPFVAKQELALFYKGRELKRRYIPDLYVCEGIVVELKSVAQLLPEHTAQLFNYMRISGKSVGYLINFAPIKRLEWRRYVL